MSTRKIQKGDTVKVITGKDKNKTGEVIAVKDNKVIVKGVNVITKHNKANAKNPNGGIIHQEAPIDISNVMYLYKGEPARVQFEVSEEGDKRVVKRLAKVAGKDAEAI